MPEGAVKVDRTTRWGNPYVVHTHELCGDDLEHCTLHEDLHPVDTHEDAVRCFRSDRLFPVSPQPSYPDDDEIRFHLAGRDLACWCPLDAPCHADVLLDLANRGES
jgi:hypothetical protein